MASRNKRTTFNHKNVTFTGTVKSSKVTVRVERTACGQNSVAGIYDINEKKWHNVKLLPAPVRKYFEKNFS